ncbi:hypothetical protein HK098_008312 [Nowakowskiella sp. JEL0407]|nr:hypothetical protein HK098_008312 [Nowakowskiella sp. JEL0407]
MPDFRPCPHLVFYRLSPFLVSLVSDDNYSSYFGAVQKEEGLVLVGVGVLRNQKEYGIYFAMIMKKFTQLDFYLTEPWKVLPNVRNPFLDGNIMEIIRLAVDGSNPIPDVTAMQLFNEPIYSTPTQFDAEYVPPNVDAQSGLLFAPMETHSHSTPPANAPSSIPPNLFTEINPNGQLFPEQLNVINLKPEPPPNLKSSRPSVSFLMGQQIYFTQGQSSFPAKILAFLREFYDYVFSRNGRVKITKLCFDLATREKNKHSTSGPWRVWDTDDAALASFFMEFLSMVQYKTRITNPTMLEIAKLFYEWRAYRKEDLELLFKEENLSSEPETHDYASARLSNQLENSTFATVIPAVQETYATTFASGSAPAMREKIRVVDAESLKHSKIFTNVLQSGNTRMGFQSQVPPAMLPSNTTKTLHLNFGNSESPAVASYSKYTARVVSYWSESRAATKKNFGKSQRVINKSQSYERIPLLESPTHDPLAVHASITSNDPCSKLGKPNLPVAAKLQAGALSPTPIQIEKSLTERQIEQINHQRQIFEFEAHRIEVMTHPSFIDGNGILSPGNQAQQSNSWNAAEKKSSNDGIEYSDRFCNI